MEINGVVSYKSIEILQNERDRRTLLVFIGSHLHLFMVLELVLDLIVRSVIATSFELDLVA